MPILIAHLLTPIVNLTILIVLFNLFVDDVVYFSRATTLVEFIAALKFGQEEFTRTQMVNVIGWLGVTVSTTLLFY